MYSLFFSLKCMLVFCVIRNRGLDSWMSYLSLNEICTDPKMWSVINVLLKGDITCFFLVVNFCHSYIFIMPAVYVKHGQNSKSWGKCMQECSLNAKSQSFNLLWMLRYLCFTPQMAVCSKAIAAVVPWIVHLHILDWFLAQTCTDVFEKLPD